MILLIAVISNVKDKALEDYKLQHPTNEDKTIIVYTDKSIHDFVLGIKKVTPEGYTVKIVKNTIKE